MSVNLSQNSHTAVKGKNVCMLVHSVYANDSRVKRTAESLVKFGYSVNVFAFWPNTTHYESTIEGVHVRQSSLIYTNGKKRFISMMWLAKKAVEESNLPVSIIHAHDLDMLAPAVYLAKKFSAKLIYDSHEWYTGSVHLINRKKEQLIWSFIEKILIKNCDEIITVNESIATLFQQTYSIKKKVWSVRNFDEMPLIKNAQISNKLISSVSSFKNKEFNQLIIYGGYLQKGRGLISLLKTLTDFPKVGIIIAGEGSLKNELINVIDNYGINDQVLFTGQLPLHELYYCYRQADIGYCYIEPISKSYELALPNKLSQYIQSELAVIGSNLPEIALLINKYKVGLVVENETELKENLIKITEKLDLYKSNSKKYSHKFSWESETKVLKEVYQKVFKD